jgi:glycosyltransferase involved in cell wall biosynthesis
MRVMVLGLRGFPGVQGGVETHAEHLYPLLADMGCDIEVLVRSSYQKYENDTYRGVRFKRLWSPRRSGIEAIVHSFIGVLYAAIHRPDVLHIHAIGPAIVTPFARLFGLRVVVTHHGPDYDRDKWGAFARWVLRTGEAMAMRFSHQRIVISEVIKDIVHTKYGRDSVVIRNGVNLPDIPDTQFALEEFGLRPREYVLQVSRLVPEKRQLDLIRAFTASGLKGWKLVLVGAIEPADAYSQSVSELADRTPGVILTGFQTGRALQELFANAGVFVLPSSHEGLPIALLEAMSYGVPVLASNIRANLELALPGRQYFTLGDTCALAESLNRVAADPAESWSSSETREWLKKHFNWSSIAAQTYAVYQAAIKNP